MLKLECNQVNFDYKTNRSYISMNILQAVYKRLEEILIQKNMSWYRLEKLSGLSKGTIIGIQYQKNKSIDLKTLMIITNTLNITLDKFFDSPYFKNDINID